LPVKSKGGGRGKEDHPQRGEFWGKNLTYFEEEEGSPGFFKNTGGRKKNSRMPGGESLWKKRHCSQEKIPSLVPRGESGGGEKNLFFSPEERKRGGTL